jgi:EpsI family protein
LAIVAGGLVLTAFTSDVAKISEPGIRVVENRPFLEPNFGDWVGGPMGRLTEAERQLLPSDTEGCRRVYKDKDGHEVYCSVVLAGREVTSIHRPELCLPSQGWQIQGKRTERVRIPAARGGTLDVMRMDTLRLVALPDGRTQESRAMFAYWFVGKDRVTAQHWQRIWWTSKDRILHNTNHRWAYILIQVPMVGDWMKGDYRKVEQDTLEVLKKFVADLYPTLAVTQS